MENIIWKQFIFNDKIYFINNYGDVIDYNNKKISQYYDKDGYKIIKLGKSRKVFKIHRLVAQLFVTNEDFTLNEINHKDFNRKNNYYENLEWCNRKYNVKYSSSQGRYKNKNGEFNGRSILKDKDIPIIKEMFQNNISIAQIAREFNVAWSTINHIIKNETWTHIN